MNDLDADGEGSHRSFRGSKIAAPSQRSRPKSSYLDAVIWMPLPVLDSFSTEFCLRLFQEEAALLARCLTLDSPS